MASATSSVAPVHSLRGRLLWLLLIAVGLAALIQGAVAYYSAVSEADEIFDYHMQQIALALRDGTPIGPGPHQFEHDVEESNFDFVIQIWAPDGAPTFASVQEDLLPQQTRPGFSDVIAHGTRYRVFSMQTATRRVIQVAQDMSARRELAGSLVLRIVVPVMLLAPVLMLTVWWVVTQSTRPLARAREQVARRAADELSPLVVPGLPDEVRPLVDEINLLFARLAEAFAAQRSFVADAAHELRSPLAALRLQIQSMQRATDNESRAVATRRLLAGLDRTSRLVDQMLMLARQDAAELTGGAPIELRAALSLAIGDVLTAAEERHIDLGIVDAETVSVIGEPEALRILFRNLLENAIKYSSDGSTVDVAIRVQQGQAVVEIADSGPGILPAERERAFDRFYRVAGTGAAGSGLGLAIAQRIAQRHQAAITLGTSSRLGGLLVTVVFSKPTAGPNSSMHRPSSVRDEERR